MMSPDAIVTVTVKAATFYLAIPLGRLSLSDPVSQTETPEVNVLLTRNLCQNFKSQCVIILSCSKNLLHFMVDWFDRF